MIELAPLFVNSTTHLHSIHSDQNCKQLTWQVFSTLTSKHCLPICRNLHFWLLLKMATPSVSLFYCRMEAMWAKRTTRTETVSWLPLKITKSTYRYQLFITACVTTWRSLQPVFSESCYLWMGSYLAHFYEKEPLYIWSYGLDDMYTHTAFTTDLDQVSRVKMCN